MPGRGPALEIDFQYYFFVAVFWGCVIARDLGLYWTPYLSRVPCGGDSVDTTPSWVAPMHSVLRGSGIFRATSQEDGKENMGAVSNLSEEDWQNMD